MIDNKLLERVIKLPARERRELIVALAQSLDQEPPASAPPAAGQQMAALLAQLAQQPTLAAITDPVAWQRAQRAERPLPGRED